MIGRAFLSAILFLILFPVLASGQGLIITPWPPMPHPRPMPLPPAPPRGEFVLKSISVEGTIKDLVGQIQMTQVVQNVGHGDMEAVFLFPVPPEAVIDRYTLMVDGKEFPAKVYTKEEARRIYEDIVRSRRDPALLEYMGWGMLKTSVFPIPAGAQRQLVLKYTQVCKRENQTCEFLFPLSTAKQFGRPVELVRVDLRITDKNAIRSVYSPTHSMDVKRPDNHTAHVSFTQSGVSSSDDLRLFWGYSEKAIGATLFSYKPEGSEDGYFLLLLAPEVKAVDAAPASKTVVFLLDHSGSMTGKKIEQARNSLRFVLNNLRKDDTFNIIAFDDKIETFKPELQRYDDVTRKQALDFTDGIYAGGSTNIDSALKTAFNMIGDSTGRPAYLIFLTDGLPTAGETNETRIADNARERNRGGVRLFSFGVGYDVNARLLDRLATGNSGSSEYVRPEEDIEAAVSRFFARMNAPVLTRPVVEITHANANRIYPKPMPDLFAGGQIISVGRYRHGGNVAIRLNGKVGAESRSYEFEGTLADRASDDDTYAFVEKLWATRRVGEIINELDLHGRNQELIDELVNLSKKHGILTPYTAFLADDRTNLHATRENSTRARDMFNMQLAEQPSGGGGVNLRMAKAAQQNAVLAPTAGPQGYAADDGRFVKEDKVQVVGDKAYFRRGGRWMDPGVTPEDEKSAIDVEQFSDKWFELARNNSQLRKAMTIPEGATIRVQNQVYRINPAQKPEG